MKEQIEGRHVLVTGAAQGIGAATATRLRKAGARLSLLDRQPIEDTDAIVCDLSLPEDVERALAVAQGRHGPVDILINNAGMMLPGEFCDREFADWEKTLDVNLRGALRLSHAILPSMVERDRGVIVNVVSASATIGVPGLAVYGAGKWALLGFTESLIGELKNRGSRVHVAAVLPNFIRTGLFEGAHLTGLGKIIVPRVKTHDVIARAIVEKAIKKRKMLIMRPVTVRLALLFRGILPYFVFVALSRGLGAARSMQHLRPRRVSEDE